MFRSTHKLAALTLLGTLLTAMPAAAQQGQHLFEWSGGWTFSGGSAFPDDFKGTPSYAEPFNAPTPAYAYYYAPPTYGFPAAPAYAFSPANNQPITSTSAYSPAAAADSPPSATINIKVPADAEIWFNDAKTTLRGPVRQFVSPPLTPDRNYSYDVKARWMEQGKPVTQNRRVAVRAGGVANVEFTPNR